jgi:hypothetical protein
MGACSERGGYYVSTCSPTQANLPIRGPIYLSDATNTLMTKLATAMPINLALGSGEIKLRLHVSIYTLKMCKCLISRNCQTKKNFQSTPFTNFFSYQKFHLDIEPIKLDDKVLVDSKKRKKTHWNFYAKYIN